MKLLRYLGFTNDPDFEQLGFDTMKAVQSFDAAKEICGLKLGAYAQSIMPTVTAIESTLAGIRASTAALCSHLYDRESPVNDAQMLAYTVALLVLGIMTGLNAIGATAAHTVTLYLFGWGAWSILVGPALTGLALVVGYLAFEKLLSMHAALQALVVTVVAVLAFWGLVEWSQARSAAIAKAEQTQAANQSYVEGEDVPQRQENSTEEEASNRAARSAWIKLMLAADLALGVLLGHFMRMRTDEDYAAWRQLKRLNSEGNRLSLNKDSLLAAIDMAKQNCMAGILRAVHMPKKKHLPYFLSVALVALGVSTWTPVAPAQEIKRQEVILLDVSGSIDAKQAGHNLFNEYLRGVRRLLASEPPSSEVAILAIATDSFSGVKVILNGRTPEQRGVFTNRLDSARRQLALTFGREATQLAPASKGTDIIGALWRTKTLFESSYADREPKLREIWIFSDMINDSGSLPLLALIRQNPIAAIEAAKVRGLIVPLSGYTIRIVGASTQNLSPEEWLSLKKFWEGYFALAGAHLIQYSPLPQQDRGR